jgi:hypothetical protein
MKRTKILGLALVAVFAMSALAATGAQATVTGGPVWITSAGPLLSGSKNIGKVEAVGVQTLKSTALTVECETVHIVTTSVNTINGGNPGTDKAELRFDHCHTASPKTCTVFGGGAPPKSEEIWAKVRSVLGYAKGKTEKEPIYDEFFPEETNNTFTTISPDEITACAAIEGKTFAVKATGTEAPKPVGFGTRKCGVIAEVGKIKAGAFEPAKSGELVKLGGLRLPTTPITEKEDWNSETKKFEMVKCALTVAGSAGTQSGIASVELAGGEEFGVEI